MKSVRFAAQRKSTELVSNLMSRTLVAIGYAARVTAAVFGDANINSRGRAALAGLNKGDNSSKSDDGNKEPHLWSG
jgi:hypothetical protein